MREIKFRAWDGEKMLVGAGHGEPLSADTLNNLECGEDKTFMQYTGLKDSKGKEIFEGDILKSISKKKNWHLGSAGFIADTYWLSQYQASGEEFTVIGNVHENPDLLK